METPNKVLFLTTDRSINLAMKSESLHSVLFDFKQWLREEIKYHDKEYEDVRTKLNELLESYSVDLDEFI